MNGTIEEPAPVEPSPNTLETLTPQQLAELAGNPDTLASVRAEVCRRLKDSPNKANYLTFRWFLPADDEDKADAFEGLIAVCRLATQKRIPYGFFPRGYPETKQRDGYWDGGIAQETGEAIKDALVDCLYDLRTLSVPEIILTALNGGFHTDADVGNALRREVRERSQYLFEYGSDIVWKKFTEITLFEVLKENPAGPQANPYSDTVEFILEEKSQVVEEMGEEGWEVVEQIVELVDNDLLPNSQKKRQRVLTEVFQTAYSVNERQARTHKSRFLAAIEAAASQGKVIFEAIAQLFDWLDCRYDRREKRSLDKGFQGSGSENP